MAKYTIEDTTLTSIADAIREKCGSTEMCCPTNMASLIAGIPTGGGGGPLVHTVTKSCDNASEVVEYFRALRPSGCNDMVVALNPPNTGATFSSMTNGQMLGLVINGTKAGYARWYSNAVNVQTTFTSSYTCKCQAGDEYVILPFV